MSTIAKEWQPIKQTMSKLAQNTKTHCKQSADVKVITKQQYLKAHDLIFDLCSTNKEHTLNNQQDLYKKYQTLLNNYLFEIVKELEISQGMVKVKKFRQIWNSYKAYLKLLKHLFSYLDRYYVTKKVVPSLQKKGIFIYCETVLNSPQSKLVSDLYIEEISKVREGDYTNIYILKEFIQIFIQVKARDNNNKIIQHLFSNIESQYVSAAGNYYKLKFKQLQSLPCGDYLKQINILYTKEQQIFNKCYQNDTSKQSFKKQFSNNLLLKYNDNLLQKSTGLIAMLQNHQVQSLKLLNSICIKLDCFSDNIKSRFNNYFQKQLFRFLSQTSKPLQQLSNNTSAPSLQKTKSIKIELIKQLFNFNKQKYQLFEQCFPGNSELINIYKFSVQKILNQYNQIYNISETLALYSDYIMRKKSMEWEQFQEQLKQIFGIFSFLIDKDVFIKDYTDYLANRLIKGQSDDDTKDYQKSFISKLKQNCGVVYTSLVESILSDHTTSNIDSQNFKKYLLNQHKKSNFEVRVLNQSIWPHEQLFELSLPEQLEGLSQIFKSYFKTSQLYKFKNFKWQYLMSKITFTFHLNKLPEQKFQWCDLIMNTLQGCLLYFVYQRRPYKISQSQILSIFKQVQKMILIGNLMNLTSNQHNIILRTRDEQTSTNFYQFNGNMIAKRIKIQYNYHRQNIVKKQSQIQNDRSLAIEMAIVKVMKARKRMKFDALVNEVSEILKNFSPTIKLIKQSIDKMLQKDYMERDAKDMTQYRYKQ